MFALFADIAIPTEIPDAAATSAAVAAIFVMIVFLGVLYWVLKNHAETLNTLGDKFAEAIKDQTARIQVIDDAKTTHIVRTTEALIEFKVYVREAMEKLDAKIERVIREVEAIQK